ncbi:f-box domain containing protein [Grosmannia clavigera kw1407]|uniref:F-box domain containing protein n=1 Tax=Grosmannia clavigera (strain kw1407 / UAMH 11150) TaxID=655863 RepID=F0XBX9_GROCL|nr:f-box domain containing protein [Grosmannia clavigera kw1407]EFX03750.1 f-box domain containing protein [Grosmannia clavigera kw1407]
MAAAMTTTPGSRLSLDRLPEDILYLILAYLDTARDNARLSATSRRLHRFMRVQGWRAFALRCFPGVVTASVLLGGSSPSALRWDQLSDSLTWQARAWDRRSLSFQALLPREAVPARRPRRQASFRPPLVVHFQAAGEGTQSKRPGIDGEEMVLWGAGEDIVARYRRRGRWEESVGGDERDNEEDDNADDPTAVARWRVFDGKAAGFRPGYDDVRGLAVVPHAMGRPHRRGVLVGRDNGHLVLLSAEDRSDGTGSRSSGFGFGRTLAQFSPGNDSSILQDRIYSLDVASAGRAFGGLDNRGGLAAVATTSHIVFYGLPSDDGEYGSNEDDDGKLKAPRQIFPTATFAMGDRGLDIYQRRRPYSVRWMAADGVAAVGLGYNADQLCFLAATPTGLALTAVAKSQPFQRRFGLDDKTLLLPSSLQPIEPLSVAGGGGNLLLSAWRDGTCRLLDIRSPSPWDMAYQDNLAPSQCFQSLLVWGSDRFVAGSQESAALKVFDLRWPRRYHHSEALPCGSRMPFPDPELQQQPPADVQTDWTVPDHSYGCTAPIPRCRARCDPLTGTLCTWHAGSRRLAARPNCSVYLQRSAVSQYPDIGVWSLARATTSTDGDLVPSNFYAGLNSCVVEAVLADGGGESMMRGRRQRSTAHLPLGDPHFAYPDVLCQRPLSLVPAPPPELGPEAAAAWRRRQAFLQHRHHFYRIVDLQWHLHEIGDGLADPHNDLRPRRLAMMRLSRPSGHRRMPPPPSASAAETDCDKPGADLLDPHRVRPQLLSGRQLDVDPVLRAQHRLDNSLQDLADFADFYTASDK